MPTPGTKTASMERVAIGDHKGNRTSFWIWRKDLELLRALYRGEPGGYALHIRAAVHSMCNVIRGELTKTEHGRALLHKLGQDQF